MASKRNKRPAARLTQDELHALVFAEVKLNPQEWGVEIILLNDRSVFIKVTCRTTRKHRDRSGGFTRKAGPRDTTIALVREAVAELRSPD